MHTLDLIPIFFGLCLFALGFKIRNTKLFYEKVKDYAKTKNLFRVIIMGCLSLGFILFVILVSSFALHYLLQNYESNIEIIHEEKVHFRKNWMPSGIYSGWSIIFFGICSLWLWINVFYLFFRAGKEGITQR
jgi:hypothetical protein